MNFFDFFYVFEKNFEILENELTLRILDIHL